MLLKVCGMRESENIEELEKVAPDMMGLIFHASSPRFVHAGQSRHINKQSQLKKVGVFVNAPQEYIAQTVGQFGLDYVQLHGDESPAYCADLASKGWRLIKVFSIADKLDTSIMKPYLPYCDYFLFDTMTEKRGGSGKKFNWALLSDFDLDKPFLLSGGISPTDVEEIQRFHHPQWIGVDINSGFETSPGVKNIALITEFKMKLEHGR